MKTIKFERQLTNDQVLYLAVEKWYLINIEVEKEVTEDRTITNAEWVDEIHTVTVLKKEEVLNPETAEEYIAKWYKKMIDKDVSEIVKERLLKEARLQIKEIEDKVEEDIIAEIWEGVGVEIV